MTNTEILMIIATALSPMIAVQVTRFLDDRNEARGRKLRVFKTLMATRAYTLSTAHVEALNTIDLEFSAKRRSEKCVLDIWQQYLDHLGDRGMEPNAWATRRVDLLVDMLYAMGKSLGYDFNKTQIKNGTYSPGAHGQIDSEQARIREMTLEMLDGRRPLPISITNIPQQKSGSDRVS
ncbi:TPA: hypothetical protein QEM85_003563 [Pseudomonas putida]|uniref:DUF6680 family protein n=1 Tax=Pseudomonas putida TaxID=303 RepID=UPI00110CDE29|nr:DUF6680 family protein [Pseudomonas putida]HDS0919450.1 hypothetical protein [Pseudomonas putida]HDS3800172.1 hypothetical protein [Pseudomonas putida]